MKRYALILALVMALAAGFGCAKKTQTTEPAYDDGGNAELRAAIEQITDARVYFAFDKFNIQPEYKDMLKTKAELLKKYSSIRVRIEGNCDERGTQEYNLALGERRARASYEYLVNLGVNPSQLEMISYGKENPAVQGRGEAAWSKNRRDDFRVISQ
ncbi:MAG: peptidoglycan-associated lipoprotein Pal [Desulfovibrio sp.]|nr:peptidoglycan-associated lipoprotein Pal [Desulfovibrio sp.]